MGEPDDTVTGMGGLIAFGRFARGLGVERELREKIGKLKEGRGSRGYDNIKNNQMLAADPDTGEVRRCLTGPRGCEITGVITTPDQRTMFLNVQHPGESTTAVSAWPFGGRPRSATVVVWKLDGGKIGS